MDWTDCSDVECKADVMSGTPVIVGTRIAPETIIEHVEDGYSLEEITTSLFPSIPLARAERILTFAQAHELA